MSVLKPIDSLRGLFRAALMVLLASSCTQPNTDEKPPLTPKWALGHIVWEDTSIHSMQSKRWLIYMPIMRFRWEELSLTVRGHLVTMILIGIRQGILTPGR